MKLNIVLSLLSLSMFLIFNISNAAWRDSAQVRAIRASGRCEPIRGIQYLRHHRFMENVSWNGEPQTHIMTISGINDNVENGSFIITRAHKPPIEKEIDYKDLIPVHALIQAHKAKEKTTQQVLDEFYKMGYPKAIDIQ